MLVNPFVKSKLLSSLILTESFGAVNLNQASFVELILVTQVSAPERRTDVEQTLWPFKSGENEMKRNRAIAIRNKAGLIFMAGDFLKLIWCRMWFSGFGQ